MITAYFLRSDKPLPLTGNGKFNYGNKIYSEVEMHHGPSKYHVGPPICYILLVGPKNITWNPGSMWTLYENHWIRSLLDRFYDGMTKLEIIRINKVDKCSENTSKKKILLYYLTKSDRTPFLFSSRNASFLFLLGAI